MSKILWGIGQLVEDPSTTIINSLKKHIFNCAPDVPSEIEILEDVQQNKNEMNETCGSTSQEASCSKTILFKSKSVQIGTALVRRHNSSIQCSKFPLVRVCRTTSVPRIEHKDESASTTSIEKKDATTQPHKLEACEEHQQALKLLRKWPMVETVLDAAEKRRSKVSYIKAYLSQVFELMKLEKIQNVPQYQSNDLEIMKLYKNANVEDTQFLIPQKLCKK